VACGGALHLWEEDKHILKWFQDHQTHFHAHLAKLRNEALVARISDNFKKVVVASMSVSSDASQQKAFVTDIFRDALQTLSDSERSTVLQALQK